MHREIDELALSAWPALQTKLYDGWVLRFADGYTRRSNSVYPMYESTKPLDEKIDYCEKSYSSLKLPSLFRLSSLDIHKELDKRLEERGYYKDDEASLRLLDMKEYAVNKPRDVFAEAQFNEKWLNGFFSCSNITNEKNRLTARKLLGNILGEVVYVSKQVDGEIIGCGYGAIERDYIGIFDIAVHKDYRGNGYGKDIMERILGEASKRGIKYAYLMVLTGNTPAVKTYERLGFKEVYRYWYRKHQG